MSFLKSSEDYYRKFIELQEKLRKSEEERLRLEMKFNEMIQFTREEEEAHHRKLQSQYQNFLDEDKKRHERNERIIKVLERIENRAALLAAKTERFQLFRKQYTTYLKRMTGDVHYHSACESLCGHSVPSLKNVGSLNKSKVKSRFRPETESVTFKGDLYKHPTIQRALNGTHTNIHDDLESLRNYLRNRSPIETPPNVLDENLSDSSEDQPIRNETTSRRDEGLDRIIRWRPKFQLPRRNKFQFRRNRWLIPEKRYSYPKKEDRSDPTVSTSFNKRSTETFKYLETPKYQQNTKRDFEYKPTSSIPLREDDFDFGSAPRKYHLDYPEKVSYSTSPQRNYTNEDLDYQLSNYPNIDVGHKPNIEYTLYPKISDGGYRNYTPSTSYLNHNKNNYDIPGCSRVSWYDHYLGRCPPNYTNHDPEPKYTQTTRDSNKYTDDYKTSKTKQDSILLNSEIRNTNYPDFRSQSTYQYKRVNFVDDQNDNVKNKTPSKKTVESISEKSTVKCDDDSVKDEFDETEDQVLSEVLPDDILEEKKSSVTKEMKFETPTDLNCYDSEMCEEKGPSVLDDLTLKKVQEDLDDYYKEKHDSLEEIQKENIVHETIYNDDDKGISTPGFDANGDVKEKYDNQDEAAIDDYQASLRTGEETVQESIEDGDLLQEKNEVKQDFETEKEIDEQETNEIQNELVKQNVLEEDREEENKNVQDCPNEKENEEDQKETVTSDKDNRENVIVVDDSKIEPPESINEETPNDVVHEKIDLDENQNKELNQQFVAEDDGTSEYQTEAQPTTQYDENEDPIQYTEYDPENVQYDEHGQPISYGDGGQYYPQYDESGQLIQQYDENGQPVVQYDNNGQPIMQYDENGQPLYQYDQYYQNQQFQEGQEQYIEGQDQQYQEEGGATQQYQDGQNQEFEGETQQYQQGDQQYQEGDQYQGNQYEGSDQQYEDNRQYQDQQYKEGDQQYKEGDHQYKEGDQQYKEGDQQYHEGDNQYQRDQQYAGAEEIYRESDQQGKEMYEEGGQRQLESNQQQESNQRGESQQRQESNQPHQDDVQQYQAENQQYQESQQQDKSEPEKSNVSAGDAEAKTMKVLDMLDTDSESTKQETKASIDSDFDFSNK